MNIHLASSVNHDSEHSGRQPGFTCQALHLRRIISAALTCAAFTAATIRSSSISVSLTSTRDFVDLDFDQFEPAVNDRGDHASAGVGADLLAAGLILHLLHLFLHLAGLGHESKGDWRGF